MKKILIICGSIFTVFCIMSFLFLSHEKVLRTNVSLEEIMSLSNHKVYLLNKDHYFVEVDIYLDPLEEDYPIRSIFNYIKEDNKNLDYSFYGYVSKDVFLNHYEIVDSCLYLDFSEEFLNSYDDFILSGIVHSYLFLPSINKVSIRSSSKEIGIYDSNYPINVENNFHNRNNIFKIVEYYIYSSNGIYYVPVTRYINDSREVIDIILDDMKDNIPSSLISYYNNRSLLLSYSFENDMMILDFNKEFQDDKIEENMKAISSSIFSNYDVESVLFKVNGKIENIYYSSKKP